MRLFRHIFVITFPGSTQILCSMVSSLFRLYEFFVRFCKSCIIRVPPYYSRSHGRKKTTCTLSRAVNGLGKFNWFHRFSDKGRNVKCMENMGPATFFHLQRSQFFSCSFSCHLAFFFVFQPANDFGTFKLLNILFNLEECGMLHAVSLSSLIIVHQCARTLQ